MKQRVNTNNFQSTIEKLTPESQIYLLNMVNMANVAEAQGTERETEGNIGVKKCIKAIMIALRKTLDSKG